MGRKGNRAMDLTGQRYGRLTVISRDNRGEYISGGIRRTAWKCRCDCGAEVVVLAGNLRSGMTRSCGCLRTGRNGRKTARETGMNQKMEILDILKRNGSISVPECEMRGIMNYKGRISELRSDGYQINKVIVADGGERAYAKYVLSEGGD